MGSFKGIKDLGSYNENNVRLNEFLSSSCLSYFRDSFEIKLININPEWFNPGKKKFIDTAILCTFIWSLVSASLC